VNEIQKAFEDENLELILKNIKVILKYNISCDRVQKIFFDKQLSFGKTLVFFVKLNEIGVRREFIQEMFDVFFAKKLNKILCGPRWKIDNNFNEPIEENEEENVSIA
jgi:hypothetical protein